MAAVDIVMAIRTEHELHARRSKRNMLLGAVLGGFVILVFGITMVKLKDGQLLEGFDHSVRPSLTEATE